MQYFMARITQIFADSDRGGYKHAPVPSPVKSNLPTTILASEQLAPETLPDFKLLQSFTDQHNLEETQSTAICLKLKETLSAFHY